MKKVLGLDVGANSIGWAVVEKDEKEDYQAIEASGSRILPMDAAMLGDFGKGNSVSQTAQRTACRSARRLRERHLLRRSRLHRVLALAGMLPDHYLRCLTTLGHFREECEPKLAWCDGRFLFQRSFEEMLAEFKKAQPALFAHADAKIPYDWTIYYLRKKALTARIELRELAWLLLHFNQKRGYYQLRGEDGEDDEPKRGKKEEYHALRVVSVEATDQKKGDAVWYNVHLENGWIYRKTSKTPLDWVGSVREFIVTTDVEEDGTPKKGADGEVKRTFRSPSPDDWALMKVKTEQDIRLSRKTVGEYIYDTLLQHPALKIRGRLVRVVERTFYREELRGILRRQQEFHPELSDENLYQTAIEELYRSNEGYRRSIERRDMGYLLLDDILFYQRPLKTKKSQIADCKYEFYTDGYKTYPLKSMPKSHPLYQEFRLWKFISQLRIFKDEEEVTSRLLPDEAAYETLYEWLDGMQEIDNKSFLNYKPFRIPKAERAAYRWNYVIEGDKKYPCNQTRGEIAGRLKKQALPPVDPQAEVALWHILYSVRDKEQIKKALARFARKHGYDVEKFVAALKGCIFENEYGAYSEKATKKLLALMRRGRYWSAEAIDPVTRMRIEKLLAGEFDERIDARTREQCAGLRSLSDFRGLEEWLASYVIYGRHAESVETGRWQSPDDITRYLETFKQYSLRNPIVEQVVTETLRTVRDVWRQSGRLDEIHIELAREMKKTNAERARDTKRMVEGEATNYRIRRLLEEFQHADYGIEQVRPYSPSHQTLFKIYEDTALTAAELPEEIRVILNKLNGQKAKEQPTRSDMMRYKLWLEQQYRSPYTGEMIPLGRLFTPAYEIEHIIPQSLYFDNSLQNKVICESEVNKLKDNNLGMTFIKDNPARKVTLSGGRVVTLFTEAEYRAHIDRYYARNPRKAKNLRAEELPQEFTARQLNDTRYISRFISGVLSHIVREADEMETTSRHVILTGGAVTDTLKKEWGLNDVWNDLMTPRFERLNAMTAPDAFGHWVCDRGKRYFRIAMPLELSKGFSLKRIDHRHHALDAVVIACTTRSHVNYLNNISAAANPKNATRYQLRASLCYKHRPDAAKEDYNWRFVKPWSTFTEDVRAALNGIVVSFKQNLRVINKATNTYQRYVDGEKQSVKQQGTNWAIRKSMHKGKVFGAVNLRFVKQVPISEGIKQVDSLVDKPLKRQLKRWLSEGLDEKKIAKLLKEQEVKRVEVYSFSDDTSIPLAAKREPVDTDFNAKKIASVTDSGIRSILLAHLAQNKDDPAEAFSPEGVERMNADIQNLNGGVAHQPIYKVRLYESAACKFPIGQCGNKTKKLVEADKGTNLFYAVYADHDGKRNYRSVPFNEVMERQKAGLSAIPEENESGDGLLFSLSPGDLVYVPSPEQLNRPIAVEDMDHSRIYKMVSCTGSQSFFVPQSLATTIVDAVELLSMNKMERAITGEMVKTICLRLQVDRLGNILKIES